MSGGSYDYTYNTVEREYCGLMYDAELDGMMEDLVKLLHDLEWWRSGDYGEEDYRETVDKFKQKWLRGEDVKRLKSIIDEQLEEKRNELYQMIGIPQKKTEKS